MIVKELFTRMSLEVNRASFAAGQRVVNNLRSDLLNLGGAVVGAFATREVIAFTKKTLEALPAINDTAVKAGIATDSLQLLRYAFENSGASSTDLDNGLMRLNKSIALAAQGNKVVAAAFQKMKISIRDSNNRIRKTDDIFLDIADGIKAIKDPAIQAEMSMKLLGNSGASLIQGFESGSGGLRKFGEEANRLGLVVSGRAISAVNSANTAINKLGKVITTSFMEIVAVAAPALESMSNFLIEIILSIRSSISLITKYRKSIEFISFAIGVILVGAGMRWLYLQGAMLVKAIALAAANSYLSTTTFILAGAFDLAAVSGAALLRVVTMFLIPFLKVAAIGALIYLVFEDIYYSMTGGIGLFSTLSGKWNEFAASWFDSVNEDDVWWIKAIKYGVGIIALFIGSIDNAFTMLFEGIEKVFNYASKLYDKIASITSSDVFSFFGGIGSKIASVGKGIVGDSEKAIAELAAGDGLSAKTMSFTRSKGSTTAINNNTGGITVNVNSSNISGSPESVGRSVGRAVKDAQLDISRATFDLLPEV
jgi:hypothetical protein